MRPARNTSKAAGVSRARLFIRRDLGWAVGYPRDRRNWLALPPGEAQGELALERDLLRRSTRRINKLLREFPRALPRVVGDSERWAATHRALIEALKPAVHGAGPLPDAPLEAHPFASPSLQGRWRRLLAEAPELAVLVRAFAWLGWTDLESLGKTLAWIDRHRVELSALTKRLGEDAIPLAARLWQLAAAHGGRRVTPVIDLLAEDGAWEIPLEGEGRVIALATAAVSKAKSASPRRPPARLAKDVAAWLHWASTQDRKTQRRSLDLFGLLARPLPTGDWTKWWSAFDRSLAAANALAVPLQGPDPLVKPRKRVLRRLERLAPVAPPAVPARALLQVLYGLPLGETLALYRAVSRALAEWPETRRGAALRLAFARHWQLLWQHSEKDARATLLRTIPAFTRLLVSKGFESDFLQPWAPVWAALRGGDAFFYGIDDDILEDLQSRESLTTFFRVLAAQAQAPNLERLRLLVQLSSLLPGPRVGPAFALLDRSQLPERYCADDLMRLAGRLTERQPERLAGVLKALLKASERYDDLDKVLKPALEAFASIGRTDILIDALEAGRLAPLLHASFKAGIIRAQKGRVPRPRFRGPQEGAAWADRYPPELRDDLRALARCDPEAEKTARRLLAKDFPDEEAVRLELAALKARPHRSAAQDIRIANLEARLRAPPTASAARLGNLAAKLRAAAARAVLEDWLERMDARFREVLPGFLAVETAPDWLEREEVVRALLPLGELRAEARDLGRRLLRRRAGPPPWDLRDHPANRRFAARMARRGLDLAPWLDDNDARAAKSPDGKALTLRLERDPLEVFQMGGHFRTCLSPGAFNYFSVFANAADINKQVLYARDGDGRVVGRMLLALTDDGGILTFHPYAHAKGKSFEALAAAFAHDLAARMGSIVVREGKVSPLVAAEWYDDGPVDLTRQHPALRETSVLRTRLPDIAPQELVPALEQAFAPLPLNELTMPMVLALPEFDRRPELALALVSRACRGDLPLQGFVRLAQLLLAAGAEAEATRLAPRLLEAALRARSDGYDWSYEVAELLVELDPVRALTLLRRTRRREVRRWDDEPDRTRLMLAARANRKLRRKNKAIALYRLALARSSSKAARAACRKALRDLGAAI